MGDAHDRLGKVYGQFGRRWAHDTSPLYEEWAVGISADAAVLDILLSLPRPKQQPNLIFASARWEGCPLASFPQWRAWLIGNADRVIATALARTTQTNEPNRCATLLPVLSKIEGPVALLEAGTAAGLCLYPDRYSAVYDAPNGRFRLDPADGPSPVETLCAVDDTVSVPTLMPDVVWRHGIDLNPLDAADPAQIDWLATLVWPGPAHDARVARLRAAAALVAADPPDIVRGDLLERLTDVAADAPADATLVVFHSAVLLYLDAAQRRRFFDLMGGLGSAIDRRVIWLSNETRGTLPEIDAQIPLGADDSHRFVQTLDGRAIALAGQHGAVYETLPFGG